MAGWVKMVCDAAALAGVVEGGDGSDGATAPVRQRGSAVPSLEVAAPASVARNRARTGMCVHRRRPDEFCSRCDG